jgi:hypothetical protein
LDFSRLDLADVQASVHVDRMLGVGGPLLRDVQLDVSLKDGWLSSRHVGRTLGGRLHQSQLDFDSRVSPPTLDLDVIFKDLDLGKLVAQFDADGAYSGSVDARLDLHSRGASPHALAANLGGEATLSAGPGTIATAHATLLTRDLIHAVRRAALRGASPEEQLNCLIAEFELREGVAETRTLALDTRDVVIVGEGSIDLGAETVQLRLLPKPHRASLLSTAATVQVTGPLRRPTVSTEKGSLVTSSTAALLKSVSQSTRLRQSWRRLRDRKAEPTLCERLLEPQPAP